MTLGLLGDAGFEGAFNGVAHHVIGGSKPSLAKQRPCVVTPEVCKLLKLPTVHVHMTGLPPLTCEHNSLIPIALLTEHWRKRIHSQRYDWIEIALILPQHPDHDALDRHVLHANRLISGVGRLQADVIFLAIEALERGITLFE